MSKVVGSGFDTAFALVSNLVKYFDANKDHFGSPSYQEPEVRADFINQFFIALGWDVNHEKQRNPFAQEVKVERSVRTSGGRKKADYAFYLSPNYRDVRFYLEAKKPSVNLESSENYFQIIRYGWNSQTPLGILTNFQEFHLIDTRYKPNIESALFHRLKKYHYTDYLSQEKFSEIYYLFSREAIADGSIHKFVADLPKSRGAAVQRGLFPGGYKSIDDSFLEELDAYRTNLARSFKQSNPGLDGPSLTEITQRTIDRLVFIRFLEDKLIEPKEIVSAFGSNGKVWGDFIAASRRLDGIYNGIVFKEHAILDSPDFQVDENQFGNICEELAHINSPYDFNSIPIHILGSIYERFLGKIITAGDERVRVEEKPEVRKAGGVYYTPQYIVNYIVENTVGKMIHEKTPDDIAKMHFADISCGSGSFLLGIFDILLAYHRRYYNAYRSKARKGDCVERDGVLHLTLKKRRAILINNIYGVDIDAQAVEVAQLSLYLKLLEDETVGTTHEYQQEFHETLLPSLSKNIVCGNSLVGTDILTGELFQGDEERKLNPMDFGARFPEIMRSGGFDAIVGNPPYVRIQTLQEISPKTVVYIKAQYVSAHAGSYDIYVVFIERGMALLNHTGKLGFIVPHKFFNAQYGRSLREIIAKKKALSHIVHFGAEQVFPRATTYTCLLFLNSEGCDKFKMIKVDDIAEWCNTGSSTTGDIPAEAVGVKDWNFTVGKGTALFARLNSLPIKLGDAADIYVGLQTSADDVYIMDYIGEENGIITLQSKALGTEWRFEKNLSHPLASGTDVKRYSPLLYRQYILFPYLVENETAELIDFHELTNQYPKTAEYLLENKRRLENRENGKFRGKEWFRFGRSQNLGIQNRVKICVPRLVENLHGTYDAAGTHFLDNVDVGGITLKPLYMQHGLKYVLALLNSKLSRWYFPQISAPFRGGWRSANRQFLSLLPFRPIDFRDKIDDGIHQALDELVDQMMTVMSKSLTLKIDKEKDYYESKRIALDRQIDNLVYKLYGLTESEIQIVEECG